MGFLARLEVERGQGWLTDPNEAPSGTESTGYVRLRELLVAALPQLTPEVFSRRLAMTTSWMVLTIANYERALLADEDTGLSLEALINELVVVLSTVLDAPVPAEVPRVSPG